MDCNQETDLDYIKRMLRISNIKAVSQETGLNYMAIRNINTGRTRDPSFDLVTKLASFFRERQ